MKRSLIMLSLCQGLLASHTHAFFFLYIQSYGMTLLAYSVIESFITVLLLLNPLYGYVTDNFKFCGKRKKSYLIACGIIGTLCYLVIGLTAYVEISLWIVVSIHFMVDIINAFRTVVVDSLCVISHKFYNEQVSKKKHKSTNSSLMLLYGSRLLGRIISVGFFGAVYNYFQNKYFFFIMGVAFLTMVTSFMTKDPPIDAQTDKTSILQNISLSMKVIKENKFVGILTANAITHASPEVEIGLNYFLIAALGFSNSDFALKSLSTEMFLLLGILMMGTMFRKSKRSTFLKFGFFLYGIWTFVMVTIIREEQEDQLIPPIFLVIAYAGMLALFEEFRTVPVVGVFLEYAPKNLEGMFISLIYFFNNFATIISNSLGAFFIYWLNITKEDFSNLPILIGIHVCFALTAWLILLFSRVPDKANQKRDLQNQSHSLTQRDKSTNSNIPEQNDPEINEEEDVRNDMEMKTLLDEDHYNEQTLFKSQIKTM